VNDMGRRQLILGTAAAGLGVSLGVASSAKALATAPGIDAPAQPFDVFTFDWRKVHFEEMRGKVVLLHFWAGWSPSCLAEMSRIDAYYRAHPGAPLLIFPVRVQDNVENRDFEDYAKQFAFPLVWHFDGRGYGPIKDAVPTSYVIDADGVLRYARAGAFTTQGLEQVVTPLLTHSGPVTIAPTYAAAVRDDEGIETMPPPVVTNSQVKIGPNETGKGF